MLRYDAVKEAVAIEDLGPLAAKGRAAAEHVYSLIRLIQTDIVKAGRRLPLAFAVYLPLLEEE